MKILLEKDLELQIVRVAHLRSWLLSFKVDTKNLDGKFRNEIQLPAQNSRDAGTKDCGIVFRDV